MKKNVFLLLLSTLFILILVYFYERRENVLVQYFVQDENTYIEYPYFHRREIDQDIMHSLNLYRDGDYDYLFIDYDYNEECDEGRLTFYIYEEKGIMVRERTKTFLVDLLEEKIEDAENLATVSRYYDVFRGQMVSLEKPMIALTFDDGPNHNTIRVLDILEKYHIRATFFILGSNILGNEATIERMNQLNMEIGNHMYSHKLLTKLKSSEIKEEIKRVDDQIFSIIHRYPTVVRPSYGTFNRRIRSLIDRPIIIWNIDTLDWKYHSSKNIYRRVMREVDDGDIILMHDIYRATANSLELIIPKLLKDGYQFVTVSELLYYKGLNLEGGKVYSSGRK